LAMALLSKAWAWARRLEMALDSMLGAEWVPELGLALARTREVASASVTDFPTVLTRVRVSGLE